MSITRNALVLAFAFASTTAFAGRANPADGTGEAHNKYLACVMDSGELPDDAAIWDALFDYCGFDAGMEKETFVARYGDTLSDAGLNLSETAALYAPKGGYTRAQLSVYAQVDALYASHLSERETLAGLAAIESKAIRTLGRSTGDMAVFAALDVAESSTQYWNSGVGGSDLPGIESKWWQIVLADAAGAGIGMLGGGIPSVGLATAFSTAVGLYAD